MLFQAERVIQNAVLVQRRGVLGFVHLGTHLNRPFLTHSSGFQASTCTVRLENLLRLPDRTIAKAKGIHQLGLPRAISIHDPDFSSIGQAV